MRSSSGATGQSMRRAQVLGPLEAGRPRDPVGDLHVEQLQPVILGRVEAAQHRLEEPVRQDPPDARDQPDLPRRLGEIGDQRRTCRRPRAPRWDSPQSPPPARVRARARPLPSRRPGGPTRRCAPIACASARRRDCCAPPAPRGRGATPARCRRCRAIRGTAIGWSCGNGSSAANRPGVRSSRTKASASHAASDGSGAASTRAHSHQSGAALGMVVQEPAAGHHERGGIVVELPEAVGRFGHQHAVVAPVAGDGPQSLEGLHRAHATARLEATPRRRRTSCGRVPARTPHPARPAIRRVGPGSPARHGS